MAYVELATLTADQALTITGRYAGQAIRRDGDETLLPHDGSTLRVYGPGLIEVGPGWWDNLVVTDRDYTGIFFDGGTPASDLVSYEWTGEENASSTQQLVRSSSSRPQTDEEYLPSVVAQQRFLHGVKTISGPLEIQTVRSKDGLHWGREVEFTLYAEQPGVYGAPRDFGTLVSVGQIMEDVLHNLVPYPSAELGENEMLVATNHVTNPSLEVGSTGWTGGGFGGDDNPTAPAIGVTTAGIVKGSRSYAGESSYLARWLGDGKTQGTGSRVLGVQYRQASMPGITPGDSVTVMIWVAAVMQAGTPLAPDRTVGASYMWLNASGGFIGSPVSMGTASGEDRGGKMLSIANQIVPAGAVGIEITVTAISTVYSSPDPAVNNDFRVYADAAAVIEEV